MSAAYRKIVIIGGGGNMGQIVLRGLLSAPQFTVTALKRPNSTSKFPEAPNLKVLECDFSPESLAAVFAGQDAVISILGGTGFGDQKAYVDAAVKAGIKRFFPSEFGVNGQSKVVQEITPFFAVKQEVLDYLVEKEKTGMTWTALIIGALTDWCIANGFLGFDIGSKKALIWDDGNTRFSGLNEDDLGKAVIGCLEHPEETANKVVYASTMATTQNEILAALEKATSAKWDVERKTTEQQLREARESLDKGDFAGAFTMVKATLLGNLPGLEQHYEVDVKDKLANDILGLTRASLEETVNRLVAGHS
ncbi:uncharacterized protein PV09_08868 [Verruconis gallopava]|uniref:NmrA-like domain-containing protein n=1 Tax=Verruconis gallopava TaxID=253628 RepID=A0A0D1ZYA2_9PEZI|nr:uncharacterized protein PV09_08868 [Verruconis gallopava]KIV99437.1 hypothetical protein PV09_08868 [Verruconis gallopava]